VTATLDVADVRALDRQGRAAAGTFNDLLMAAFVATLGEWHAAEPARDEEAWIRVGVPMSLRTKSDYGLPAAKRVSMVFLDPRAARAAGHRHRGGDPRDRRPPHDRTARRPLRAVGRDDGVRPAIPR
jgi:hypothetical protein